jgi:very-short-patch-repair endonuclease
MTASERKLWQVLRYRDLKIRRQAPVGRYIADFIHHASKLVIEIDGGRHRLPEQQLHDAERDAWFASQGYRVIRFSDAEAYGAPDDLAARIESEIQQSPSPNPLPSRERAKI